MTPHQRQEALQRLAAGETMADVARTYAVEAAPISRLAASSPFEQGAVGDLRCSRLAAARVAFVKACARVTGRLLALARIRVPRLSPIGNRRNPPPRAENAANFFRSSAK